MKTPRTASDSSTTSDNTSEFIDIVKKFDVVYNTHNPDYKNVEVKMKVWSQISEEIGLSVDASKRKWKNLRDSYTKYLRSFRIGGKTSKKYQYWAHADHMDFLKPYQGPGRNAPGNGKSNEDDENECDLGFQMLTKAANGGDEDQKVETPTPSAAPVVQASSVAPASANVPGPAAILPSVSNSPSTPLSTITPSNGAVMMPMPSLPNVPLPPSISGKPISTELPLPTTTLPAHIFSLPQFGYTAKTSIPMPATSTAGSVGCLFIEPQLFADTFKKELSIPSLGVFQNPSSQITSSVTPSKPSTQLISKVRPVHPAPQTAAINLSVAAASSNPQPPPSKVRKSGDQSDIDVGAILQANRDLDANTLFFLSLARTVRLMPTRFQSLAKMRCLRIISDIELELDNVSDSNGYPAEPNQNGKYCNTDTPPPPNEPVCNQNGGANEASTESFVYMMSPSRVESMIDISSEEEQTMQGN